MSKKRFRKTKYIAIEKHEKIYKLEYYFEGHEVKYANFCDLNAMYRFLSHHVLHAFYPLKIQCLKKKTDKYENYQKRRYDNHFTKFEDFFDEKKKFNIIKFPLKEYKNYFDCYKILDSEATKSIINPSRRFY